MTLNNRLNPEVTRLLSQDNLRNNANILNNRREELVNGLINGRNTSINELFDVNKRINEISQNNEDLDLNSNINKNLLFIDNPLNYVDVPTYNISLYMTSEVDSFKFNNLDELGKISNTNEHIDDIRKIIIAETGTTGFNIISMEIEQSSAPSSTNRNNSSIAAITIKIKEPLGNNFYDSIYKSGKLLNIKSVVKAPVFVLQLQFKGYLPHYRDKPGEIIDKIGAKFTYDYDHRSIWVYTCIISQIETQLSESGSEHTLKLIPKKDIAFGKGIQVITEPMNINATTIKDFFDKLKNELKNREKKQYGEEMHEYNFKFLEINPDIGHPNLVNNRNPENWEIVSLSPRDRATTPSTPRPNTNIKVTDRNFNIGVGTTIQSLVDFVFSNTREGQILAKKNEELEKADNKTDGKIFYSISSKSELKGLSTGGNDFFHTQSNDYKYDIEYVIYPTLVNTPTPTEKEINELTNDTLQKERILSRIKLNKLRKVYNYLFTGKNTEIIKLDLTFNNLWNQLITSYDHVYGPHAINDTNPLFNRYVQERSSINGDITILTQTSNRLQEIDNELISLNTNSNIFSSLTEDEKQNENLQKVISEINKAQNDILRLKNQNTSERQQKELESTERFLREKEIQKNEISRSIFSQRLNEEKNRLNIALRGGSTNNILNNSNISDEQRELLIRNDTDIANAARNINNNRNNINANYLNSKNKRIYAEDLPNDTNILTGGILQDPRIKNQVSGTGEGRYDINRGIFASMLHGVYELKSGSLLQIEMEIKGDPYWLTLPSTRVGFYEYRLDIDHTTPNPNISTPQLLLIFKYPSGYDSYDELDLKNNTTLFNGVYNVLSVIHTFSDGKFTQKLSLARDITINPNVDGVIL